MLAHVATALTLAITVVAYLCARATRPDRNYWPMIRVMWAALMAVYGGAFVNNLLGQRGGTVVRVAFSLAMLAALCYALWFMRKRNRTKRYEPLNIAGERIFVPEEEMRAMAGKVESWAWHGDMAPDLVPRMREALAHWDAHQGWRERVTRQAAELRRAKGR